MLDEPVGVLTLGSSFADAPGGTAHWTFDGGTNYKNASGEVPIAIAKRDQRIAWSPPRR